MDKLTLQLNIILITTLSVVNIWYFQIFDNINWGVQIFILSFIIYLIEFIFLLWIHQYGYKNIILISLVFGLLHYFISIYLPALRIGDWINIAFTLSYLLINVYLIYKIQFK